MAFGESGELTSFVRPALVYHFIVPVEQVPDKVTLSPEQIWLFDTETPVGVVGVLVKLMIIFALLGLSHELELLLQVAT